MLDGLSTLGITFGYGVETVAGQKPTSFTQLHRINALAGVSVDPQSIDASALEDKKTKRVPGRDDLDETYTVTVNKTPETVAEWKKVIADYQALTGGKRMWFETITPGFDDAEFIIAAPPSILPIAEKNQNELLTMAINLILMDMIGDSEKVDFTEPSGTGYSTQAESNSVEETEAEEPSEDGEE